MEIRAPSIGQKSKGTNSMSVLNSVLMRIDPSVGLGLPKCGIRMAPNALQHFVFITQQVGGSHSRSFKQVYSCICTAVARPRRCWAI